MTSDTSTPIGDNQPFKIAIGTAPRLEITRPTEHPCSRAVFRPPAVQRQVTVSREKTMDSIIYLVGLVVVVLFLLSMLGLR